MKIRLHRPSSNLGNPGISIGENIYADVFREPYMGMYLRYKHHRVFFNLRRFRISRWQ